MPDPLATVGARVPTPQSEPIPGEDQIRNAAGGYVYSVDVWTRLRRFLILGTEGGTYYANERDHTLDNVRVVYEAIEQDGKRTVDEITSISVAGRNPRQHPVIFAFAACCSAQDQATRVYALRQLSKVCRTGTHLFMFAGYIENTRGWGRALRNAVAGWYFADDEHRANQVALQLIKYRQRDGWTHRDLLRLSHPVPTQHNSVLLKFAANKLDPKADTYDEPVPDLLGAYLHLREEREPRERRRIVQEYRLPWETLDSEDLRDPQMWAAIVPTMGIGALVRNLGRLTANRTLGSQVVLQSVVQRLQDPTEITRSRIHPMQVLLALKTYATGQGDKGSLSWLPVPDVLDALDSAFYLAFTNVERTGKAHLLALDVSGSMGARVAGSSLTAREAACAMAAVTINTEERVHCIGFTGGQYNRVKGAGYYRLGTYDRVDSQSTDDVSMLPFSRKQRLDDMVARTAALPFGPTDCALPMLHAMKHGIKADVFVIYTDNESWVGSIHATQALRDYRQQTGISDARLVVCAVSATRYSVADPHDPHMLDVVGFDSATPQLIADFVAGRV